MIMARKWLWMPPPLQGALAMLNYLMDIYAPFVCVGGIESQC